MPNSDQPLPVLLVTGMSGAGKTTMLKALEDLGYEAVDNLPLSLVAGLVELQAADRAGRRGIAVGVDFRTRAFDPAALSATVEAVEAQGGIDGATLFLDCQDETLARRFTETRRRHPLSAGRPIGEAIRLERERLAPAAANADMVIDTSDMAPRELARFAAERFALEERATMSVTVVSFAYRGGLPRQADLVFDVRFLANPHYDPALRPLTGRDAAVAAFIDRDPSYRAVLERLAGLLEMLLPLYRLEGKSYLTVAIGCTGGRHRSVLVAEELAARLRDLRHEVILRHRELAEETPR